jgi:hypothetical protein
MKLQATALAAERSNAIGTVELECTPHGLSVIYLGVGAFHEGYAPGALTTGTRVTVPWASVSAARVEGEQLYLEVDPALTPHSRLVLSQFSTGEHSHHKEAGKQRFIIWVGATAAALVVALISALVLPRFAPEAGASVALGVGGFGALAIIVVGLLADRQIGRLGLEGEAAREAFLVELGRFIPNLVRLPGPPAPTPKPFVWPSFEGWLPRTTVAVVITLTACVLGAVLTARWMLSPDRDARDGRVVADNEPVREPRDEPENVNRAPAPPTPAPSASETASSAPAGGQPGVASGGRCSCRRSSSLLWNEPIPKLGVLTLARKLTTGPVRKRLEADVAVVNDSDQDLRDIGMGLEFFEQDPPPSNKRYSVANRSVFFEGPLKPGQAIKWNVEARGSEFTIDRPIPGDIGPTGDEAAPANLIAELLEANHRPVRLWGAMLLGYLGDPRAKEAALKLKEALREEEAPYLERLLRALGDVRTCDLTVDGAGPVRSVKACVFNASNENKSKLGLRVRALDSKVKTDEPTAPPPNVVAEGTFDVPGELPSQAGVRVSASMDLSRASGMPAAFEGYADRVDLLP